MDWVSFGYGAGALATAWSAWDARDEVAGRLWVWRHQWRAWQAERRIHRLADMKRIRELERDLKDIEAALADQERAVKALMEYSAGYVKALGEELDAARAEIERVTAADKKWAAYKKLSTNERATKAVAAYTASVAKAGVPVGPGAASMGTVTVHLGPKKGGNRGRPKTKTAPPQTPSLSPLHLCVCQHPGAAHHPLEGYCSECEPCLEFKVQLPNPFLGGSYVDRSL